MAFATEEADKGPEEVMELDPKNQAVEAAKVEEPVAAAPEEAEQAMTAQTAVQPEPQPPQLAMPSLEDRSTYLVGDEIRVPTEIVGQPSGSVTLSITAARCGIEAVTALVPLALSEGGQARHEWTFKPEMEGEYNIQIVVTDNLGNQARHFVTLFAKPKPDQEAEKQEEQEADLAAQQEDPNKKEMTFAT